MLIKKVTMILNGLVDFQKPFFPEDKLFEEEHDYWRIPKYEAAVLMQLILKKEYPAATNDNKRQQNETAPALPKGVAKLFSVTQWRIK